MHGQTSRICETNLRGVASRFEVDQVLVELLRPLLAAAEQVLALLGAQGFVFHQLNSCAALAELGDPFGKR